MAIASGMKQLTESIAASHRDRTKTVFEIREEAKRMTGNARALVKDFQALRQKTGTALRQELAWGKIARKSDVEKTLADTQGLRKREADRLRQGLAEETAARRSEVRAILGDARQTVSTSHFQRMDASKKLREGLARERSSRDAAVEGLIKGFARSREEAGKVLRQEFAEARAERASTRKAMVGEVKEMRAGFRRSYAGVRADIYEARAAWQELAGKTPVTGHESPDLEGKLLAAISQHPQGITLTEVAGSLGVVPIVLGRVSRRLLDAGKIRKEDRVYFPL